MPTTAVKRELEENRTFNVVSPVNYFRQSTLTDRTRFQKLSYKLSGLLFLPLQRKLSVIRISTFNLTSNLVFQNTTHQGLSIGRKRLDGRFFLLVKMICILFYNRVSKMKVSSTLQSLLRYDHQNLHDHVRFGEDHGLVIFLWMSDYGIKFYGRYITENARN